MTDGVDPHDVDACRGELHVMRFVVRTRRDDTFESEELFAMSTISIVSVSLVQPKWRETNESGRIDTTKVLDSGTLRD